MNAPRHDDAAARQAALLRLRVLVDECIADPSVLAEVRIERGIDLGGDPAEPRPHENGTMTATLLVRGGAAGTLWPGGSAVRDGR